MTVECVLTTASAPTRTLEALLEASYRLSRTTTTAQAADVVAEAARELRYADGVHLYLSEQLGSSVWSNANQSPGSADRGTLSFDYATQAPDLAACLAAREDLFVPDGLSADAPRQALRRRFGMASVLYVPLLDIGVLVLWWHRPRTEPPPFAGDWRAFLDHGAQALRRRLETTNLRDLSVTDPLTGLTNRRTLVQQLQNLPAGGCVLLLDLDHFKRVNDTLGHRHGDRTLQAFAQLLLRHCPTAGCVARYGGEEFAVVFPVDGRNAGAMAVEELRHTWARKGMTFSAGLATHREKASPEETLEAADRAMYEAKQAGRDRLVHAADIAWTRDREHGPAIQVPAAHGEGPGLTLDELDEALENGAVVVHYQPVLDTRSGCVVSVEALARLRHPRTGELLQPADFLPLAERTGRVRLVDRQVATQAVHAAAQWRQGPFPALTVAVNVSVDHLDDDALVPTLLTHCRTQGLPPSALVVEVTETLRSVTGRGHELAVSQLRDAGVGVSLDDFGTGFSALSYLLRFPVSGIKIDTTFTAALGTVAGRRLVHGMVDLALSMGLQVVAEGVETPHQLAWLTERRCPLVQGYLLSGPVPADQLAQAVLQAQELARRLARERADDPAPSAPLPPRTGSASPSQSTSSTT